MMWCCQAANCATMQYMRLPSAHLHGSKPIQSLLFWFYAPSGVPSNCRRSTPDYYCKRQGAGTNAYCQYNYKPPSVVCNDITGATCTGIDASCPVVRCKSPPSLPEGMRYWHACRQVNVGDMCKAVCIPGKGYVGDGYTMECRAGGNWGPVMGTGCTKK